MARINQQLLSRLEEKLGIGKARLYSLIAETANATNLPRNLAALAFARERGINISMRKYASAEELAELRHSGRAAATSAVRSDASAPSTTTRRPAASARKTAATRRTGTTVFVVHGRDEKARKAMFAFLRSIGLNPLEWTQALLLTRSGSPYVGDVLDKAFEKATAVVVLMTPDDEARLRPDLVRSGDGREERTPSGQARANVLFEAGMAFGRNERSTVLVQIGKCRPFSDVGGRHVVRLDNSSAKRAELIVKLKACGCVVNQEGTDWMTEGEFTIGLPRKV